MSDDTPVFVLDEYGPTRMIRTHRWKYVHRYPDGPNELYDLANDPHLRPGTWWTNPNTTSAFRR